MTEPDRIPAVDLPPGAVRRVGDWAVGNAGSTGATAGDRLFAVSRRCRHQFADLAGGSIDAEGCLVCPWHQSRYDVRTGENATCLRVAHAYEQLVGGFPAPPAR